MPTKKKSGDHGALASRKPQQERSLMRYNLLLDAAHGLLLTQDIADIGLYQVADRAGVPTASAYHFFPSPGTIFIALAERYRTELAALVDGSGAPADERWQTWLHATASALVQCCNQNLPMSKVVLGGAVPGCDDGFIDLMANRVAERCCTLFHMPAVRDLQRRLHVMLTIILAIWALSFSRYGRITPEFDAEASLAAIAYCRTFFPEFIEPRDAPWPQ